jgi:hypothetical protein
LWDAADSNALMSLKPNLRTTELYIYATFGLQLDGFNWVSKV